MENNQFKSVLEYDSKGRKLSVFTKKKYYAYTFLIFGIASLIFIGFVNVMSYTGLALSFVERAGQGAVLGITLAFFIAMIFYNWFSWRLRPLFFILSTILIMGAATFVIGLLVSLAWTVYDIQSDLNTMLLIMMIPAGFMVLAGMIGTWKTFEITTKWYYLLIFASMAAITVILISVFVISDALVMVAMGLITVIFFLTTVFEMNLIKKRAEYFDKYINSKMNKLEIFATIFQSAFRLFYTYVILIYYATMFLGRK